jgi:hypothetical protein
VKIHLNPEKIVTNVIINTNIAMSSYHGQKYGSYRGGNGGTRKTSFSGARGDFRRGTGFHVPPPVSNEPFGPEIDKINIATLLIEENAPTIENVNYVASYNWLDAKSPIILVPGKPNLALMIDIHLLSCIDHQTFPVQWSSQTMLLACAFTSGC